MLIAQISDLHVVSDSRRLYDFVDSNTTLARAVAVINGLDTKVDLVLVTGDTTNCGTRAAYAMLERLLEGFEAPVFVIPGNHDTPAFLREVGGGKYRKENSAGYEKQDYVIEEFPLRVIMLDSTSPGDIHGMLLPEQFVWLSEQLASSARPTLVCIHHPPLPTGHAHMDPLVCRNGDELVSLLQKYRQVQALACGHTHRAIFQRAGDLTIFTCPGLATAIKSDFNDSRGFFIPDESGFMLHRYTPESGLISFVETLPKQREHCFAHVNSCPATGEA